MKVRSLSTLATVILLGSSAVAGPGLPRSSPEGQGVASSAVLAFVEAADDRVDLMNSFMLVRHGHVVAEGWWTPYSAESRHSLYSLSKSFTSTAVGLAAAEGKLSVDDEVLKYFPDDAPADPSGNLKAMRVSDLLRMSTGQQTEPPRTADEPWVKTFLSHPVPFKPGTHFLYNTSATYMLSAIVQKATGETTLDYLRPRLFDPLGIDDPTWEASPQGVSAGGYGLSVRTEDIAKFGQLYLQKGKWDGKQLVPEGWVEAATARETSNGSNPNSDWDQGYGYQFWRCRHGAYRGDGAFGQFCIVLPEQDAVIAITSGTRDMQGVLNLVWEHLLPAMKRGPLAEGAAEAGKLSERLKTLSLPAVEGIAAPSSIPDRTYVFPANDREVESVRIEGGAEAVTVVAKMGGVERRITSRPGEWQRSPLAFGSFQEQPAAASLGWTAADALTGKICFYETPFVVTFRLKFEGDEARLESESNVGFGPTTAPSIVGRAE